MSILTRGEQAVREVASELERQGYRVIFAPESSLIPFDLEGYRPDLLATRDDENAIVEVKTRRKFSTIERYKQIAEIVGRHPNWRFLMLTIDSEDRLQDGVICNDSGTASMKSLSSVSILNELNDLIAGQSYRFSLPYLWMLYIKAVRAIGHSLNIPMDVNSDRSVLDYMYSLGEISMEEFDWALGFWKLRNEAVHNLNFSIDRNEVEELYHRVKEKLDEAATAPAS
ncbi:MAG: hypothetical protein ACFB9N_10365 [Geitlerinemataceae cyanobacterium]